jgi:hypothetical protein
MAPSRQEQRTVFARDDVLDGGCVRAVQVLQQNVI